MRATASEMATHRTPFQENLQALIVHLEEKEKDRVARRWNPLGPAQQALVSGSVLQALVSGSVLSRLPAPPVATQFDKVALCLSVNREIKNPSYLQALDGFFEQPGFKLQVFEVLTSALMQDDDDGMHIKMHFKFEGDFSRFDVDDFTRKLRHALGPCFHCASDVRPGSYDAVVECVVLKYLPELLKNNPGVLPALLLMAAGIACAEAAKCLFKDVDIRDRVMAAIICASFGAAVGSIATAGTGPGIAAGAAVGAAVGLVAGMRR